MDKIHTMKKRPFTRVSSVFVWKDNCVKYRFNKYYKAMLAALTFCPLICYLQNTRGQRKTSIAFNKNICISLLYAITVGQSKKSQCLTNTELSYDMKNHHQRINKMIIAIIIRTQVDKIGNRLEITIVTKRIL